MRHGLIPLSVDRQRDNNSRLALWYELWPWHRSLIVLVPVPYEFDVSTDGFYRHPLDQIPPAALVFPHAHKIERVHAQSVRCLPVMVIDAIQVHGQGPILVYFVTCHRRADPPTEPRIRT